MEGGQMAEERKALMIRFPKELHQEMKEVVAYLGTDMTAFINELVIKKVKTVTEERYNIIKKVWCEEMELPDGAE